MHNPDFVTSCLILVVFALLFFGTLTILMKHNCIEITSQSLDIDLKEPEEEELLDETENTQATEDVNDQIEISTKKKPTFVGKSLFGKKPEKSQKQEYFLQKSKSTVNNDYNYDSLH